MQKSIRHLGQPSSNRVLAVLLRITWYRLDRLFTKRIQHLDGLTSDRYTILRWLHDIGPASVSQSDLVDLTGFHPNTISQVLSSLEKNKWIARTGNPHDKRVKLVRITAEGISIVTKALPIAEAIQSKLLSELEPSTAQEFLAHLSTIAAGCTKLLEDDRRL